MTNLFKSGYFTLSSGIKSKFKIDCDALTDEDIETLAKSISRVCFFTEVEGVPTGGLRLAKALEKYKGIKSTYIHPNGVLLIVDDVLTTGDSMEKHRAGREAFGLVIFSRGPLPSWVDSIFSADEDWFNEEVITE